MTMEMPTELQFNQTDLFYQNIKGCKLLFLDVNGVISNKSEPCMIGSNNCINERNLNNLYYILENVPDIKVILSSSWRYQRSIEDCQNLVNHYFGISNLNVVGRTPCVTTPEELSENIVQQVLTNNKIVYSRGYEIKYVVDRLEPSHYVILDDLHNFLDEQKEYHIQTNSLLGLTLEDAKQAIEILNRGERYENAV